MEYEYNFVEKMNQTNNFDIFDIILDAILKDRYLHQLYNTKAEIYSKLPPTLILKDRKVEFVKLDETNHPLLPKINKLIEHRIEQIKHSYNKNPTWHIMRQNQSN